MGRLCERLASGQSTLWIDADAYAEHLLANGSAPWTDATGLIAWHRKVMSLLNGDVAALSVGRIAEAWIEHDAGTREAMALKRRTGAPLRALLAGDALRGHLLDVVGGIGHGVAGRPLALVVPSPRSWLLHVHTVAHGETPEIDEDDVESAAVYMADFLRIFAEAGVDAVLLDPGHDAIGAQAPTVETCAPVLNLAERYGWDVGARLPGTDPAPAMAHGWPFVVAGHDMTPTPTGLVAGAAHWDDGAALQAPTGGFVFCTVPARMRPETVMANLARWR